MTTYAKLMKLAKTYGVDDNELYKSLAAQYVAQLEVIEQMQSAVKADEMMMSKEYVKGRENVYLNPIVKELPKHHDSANKTAAGMLDIIAKCGKEKPKAGKLADLFNE